MNATVNGVSSRSGKEQVMSARLPQDLIHALLSQLDRMFVWQVSPFSFFFCFLDQSPLLLIIYISPSFLFLFSPPLCHALVLTLTLFFMSVFTASCSLPCTFPDVFKAISGCCVYTSSSGRQQETYDLIDVPCRGKHSHISPSAFSAFLHYVLSVQLPL